MAIGSGKGTARVNLEFMRPTGNKFRRNGKTAIMDAQFARVRPKIDDFCGTFPSY